MDERETELMDILNILNQFKPYTMQEAQDKVVMLKYMHDFKDIFERTNLYAHMTSSPWILNEKGDKVLMAYHTIYNSWGWCGGHCDGDRNMSRVAIREGKEESGLQNLKLVSETPLAIDILPIYGHKKHEQYVASHVHLNITFLCIAQESECLTIKVDENSAVKWIRVEDVHTYVTEQHMHIVYQKLMEKSQRFVCKF